jgi:serine protease Do
MLNTNNPSRPLLKWGALSVSVALAVGFAVLVPGHGVPTAHAQTTTSAAPLLVQGLPDFTVLVDAVGPSVVNIRTTEKVAVQQATPGLDPDMLEFFRRFGMPLPPGFGQPSPQQPQHPGGEDSRPRGIGSGFVLTADGYIMTNAHVVDGADELLVTLPDKREFKAKLIGEDKRTDVALVKIEAKGLTPVKVGNAKSLRVGEWVMAIGSPYGLENTVTAGIVSAKQRETGDFLPFIQTDVAINPGNSGGPLINMRGEVVGINSQIYSRSGGFQGISFAIPMDEAIRVSDQLKSQGFVTRGRIGVSIDEVTPDVAEATGLDKPKGSLVRGVENGSPADKAGLMPGDVILSFNGQAIEKTQDLPRLVGNTKPGSRSNLVVWRQGKEKTLSIVVGQFDNKADQQAQNTPAQPESAAVLESVGLSVRALTPNEVKALGAPGVFVESVTGMAARAGLRAEDVILAVANQKVSSVRGLQTLLGSLSEKKAFNVLFRRGEWVQYAMIRR